MKALFRTIFALALLTGWGGLALAAPAPGAQAVIAFINLLEQPIVADTEARKGGQPEAIARSLLEQLAQSGVLAQDIAQGMLQSIDTGILPRDVFVLYLADLFNGAQELATRDVTVVERELKAGYCNLHIPSGRVSEAHAGRILQAHDVSAVVNSFLTNLGCLSAELRSGYWTEVE